MKIAFESELMENHKHAIVMAPELAFDVLQTQDGSSLFFSIGTDNVFYLTREVTQTATGWSKIDLSSALSAQHNNSPVIAKTFSIAQNASSLNIDLALVATVSGVDYLYLSLGNVNTDATWVNGVTWTAVPFDAANVTASSPFTIADVFLMNIAGTETIFVDILRSPGDPLKLIDRYYITPAASPKWNARPLPEDASAGSISSCLGQRKVNYPEPAGIYTFGTIGNEAQLVFVPQYNFFNHKVAPSPARLTLPAGASAIASAINSSGQSNLFVSGTQGLYVFTPDNQHDGATPVQIVTNPITAGANSLAAATAGGRTAIWGIDPQGNLFYTSCPAGQEATPAAWSVAIPLLPSAEQFAFFLNLNAGNNVLLAHVDNENLVQLTQDPVTSAWQQRSILLPGTSMDDVIAYNTYTTHIQFTNDDNSAAPNTNIQITATSPVSVYINDIYHRLSPTVPVSIASDATGVITVVQETQSINGIHFRVVLTDYPAVVADVNSMSKAQTTLNTVTKDTDLGAIQVTNADGTQQSLVPSTVSSQDKAAAAGAISQLMQAGNTLPQDGSVQKSSPSATATPRYWGVSFVNGKATYLEGDEVVQRFREIQAASGKTVALDSPGQRLTDSSIEMAFGDMFAWLKHAFEKVAHFFMQVVDDVYHFIITIGDAVYHAVLTCVNAVVSAIEFVWNKIKTFFEDLIKWLGFLFQWNDIVRTHNVLKNIINQYINYAISNLDTAEADLKSVFTSAVENVDQWAGIPANIPPDLSGSTSSSMSAQAQQMPGQNSPQSNYGTHHFKSNAGSSNATINNPVVDGIESLLEPLVAAIGREEEVIQAAIDQIKTDIIDQAQSLTFVDFLKRLAAIISTTLLESVENVLIAGIDILKAMAQGISNILNGTLDIPVISWLYKQITGNELSLLDVVCLIAAIPITIGYKLLANAAPFPDDATTAALMSAPSFAAIQNIFYPPKSFATKDAVRPVLAETVSIIDNSTNNLLVILGGIYSLIGSTAMVILLPLSKKFSDVPLFPALTAVFYPAYAFPSIAAQIQPEQKGGASVWIPAMNSTVCGIMTLKVCADAVIAWKYDCNAPDAWGKIASPAIDFFGNVAWQVPTTASIFPEAAGTGPNEALSTANIMGFVGGTFFDATGWMSPLLAKENDPVTWAALAVLAGIFNLGYGALTLGSSILIYDGKPNG